MLTGMAAVGSLFHTATGTAFADLVIDAPRDVAHPQQTLPDLVETSLLSGDRECFERPNHQFGARFARGTGAI
jgi:hypothetical protein